MEANWAWMKRNTRGGVSMMSDPLKAPENARAAATVQSPVAARYADSGATRRRHSAPTRASCSPMSRNPTTFGFALEAFAAGPSLAASARPVGPGPSAPAGVPPLRPVSHSAGRASPRGGA